MIISLREHYDSALEKALEALEEGNLIIYPTDTLYGLGCDATNNDAVEKIYKIKNRERDKPLSMLVANMEQLNKFFSMSEEEKEVMLRYLPGPYTFIVDGKGEFEGKRIGVRVP
ncbi:MAG: Sua5/YciO/YrdC/YwlC family protein, partial [Methanobacteriota archaeon]